MRPVVITRWDCEPFLCNPVLPGLSAVSRFTCIYEALQVNGPLPGLSIVIARQLRSNMKAILVSPVLPGLSVDRASRLKSGLFCRSTSLIRYVCRVEGVTGPGSSLRLTNCLLNSTLLSLFRTAGISGVTAPPTFPSDLTEDGVLTSVASESSLWPELEVFVCPGRPGECLRQSGVVCP